MIEIIEKAAKLIEHNAETLRECCSVDGKWDHPDDEALYLEEMETARQLREYGENQMVAA